MSKANGTVKWLGPALAAFVLLGTIIATFVWAQTDIKAIDTKTAIIIENVSELKTDGCKPATKNTFDIGLIQKDIATIQESQKKIEEQQKEGFKEILKRLPK